MRWFRLACRFAALGVRGGGAHTHEVHILVSSLVPRATLLARLLADLD